MTVKVLKYAVTGSVPVQAFVDVLIDEWIVVNGVNYNRDRTLKAPQLKYWLNNAKHYRSAIEIGDADLAAIVATEILSAIEAHVEALPPAQRALPPERPPRPRPAAPRPQRAAKPVQKSLPTDRSEGLPQPARPRPRLIAGRK